MGWLGNIAAGAVGAVAVATLAGCMSGNGAVVADVSPRGWNSPAEMTLANTDTVSTRGTSLYLRHDQRTLDGRYAVEFVAPSGRVASLDTVEVKTARNGGRYVRVQPDIPVSIEWTLTGFGRGVRLAEQGRYAIRITPLQNTVGVWNVGLEMN